MSELSPDQQLAIAEQLQAQLGALEQQRAALGDHLQELRQTRRALKALEEGVDDRPLLVPLGSGAFIQASVVDAKKVLAPLGGGILAEETPAGAIARIEAREAEANRAIERMESNRAQLEEQLTSLVAALQASGALGPAQGA